MARLAGAVYWLTGLSGAGKSTIAGLLSDWVKQQGVHPIMLDGDVVRDLLPLDARGHDRDSRLKIARFNAHLCHFLSVQGLTVICPTISLFHEVQAWNRENIPGYVEIFIDVPLHELQRRDPKGLYAQHRRGELKELVGLDIAAELPLHPDIHLSHADGVTPAQCLQQIIDFERQD